MINSSCMQQMRWHFQRIRTWRTNRIRLSNLQSTPLRPQESTQSLHAWQVCVRVCVVVGGWVVVGGGRGWPSDAGLQMMRPSDRKYNSVGRSMIVPSTT